MCMDIDIYVQSTAVLTSNESQAIYEALYPARNEWFNIGAALGIDNDTLTAIKNTNGESKTCLREMISHLLHTQPSSLTWARFCECLRSCTVERNDVAEKIENYVKGKTCMSVCTMHCVVYSVLFVLWFISKSLLLFYAQNLHLQRILAKFKLKREGD